MTIEIQLINGNAVIVNAVIVNADRILIDTLRNPDKIWLDDGDGERIAEFNINAVCGWIIRGKTDD